MIHRIVSALHTMRGQHGAAGRMSQGGTPPQLPKRSEHPLLHYDDEEAARVAIATVEEFTMLSYQRLVTLWQQVQYLDGAGISGSLVECGTWKGGASALMALAHRQSGHTSRALHLFDSFQGLPEPDQSSDGEMAASYAGQRASGALRSIGKCVGTLEENKHVLTDLVQYPRSLIHYHVGWFQDTLRVVPESIKSIALLRIDGDWYESTKICLARLVPLVSPGGIVVIDDYGKWPGCRKALDEFMRTLVRPLFLNHIDAAGRYFIVP